MKVQVELGALYMTRPAIRRWKQSGKVQPKDIRWSEPEGLELGDDGDLTLSLGPSPLPQFVRIQVPGMDVPAIIQPGAEDA